MSEMKTPFCNCLLSLDSRIYLDMQKICNLLNLAKLLPPKVCSTKIIQLGNIEILCCRKLQGLMYNRLKPPFSSFVKKFFCLTTSF